MKSTTALGAILCAGFATSALAQTASFTVVPSVNTIDATNTTVFTVDVFASADFGTHISGGAFGFDSIDGGGAVSDIQGGAQPWAAVGENNFGYAGNGDHNGLVFAQVIFPPFFPPASETALSGGPVLVASFQFSLFAGALDRLEVNLTTLDSAPFALEIFDENTGSFTQISSQDIQLGSFVVQIPAPSATALFGLAALGATRRRRT